MFRRLNANEALFLAVFASAALLILWGLVLTYGTPEEKGLSTVVIVVSPIPPIP
jgi:hypothetical protein